MTLMDKPDADEIEYKAAVDIPQIGDSGNLRDEWYCIDYFETYEEALKWAQDNLGADEEGKICVVTRM